MEEQVLSIEQMQELIDKGIDVSKASMCWVSSVSGIQLLVPNEENSTLSIILENEFLINQRIPTFTLQDVLDKIFKFTLSKVTRDVYTCHTYVNGLVEHKTNGKSALEAAFNMLKWCKENKYI